MLRAASQMTCHVTALLLRRMFYRKFIKYFLVDSRDDMTARELKFSGAAARSVRSHKRTAADATDLKTSSLKLLTRFLSQGQGQDKPM